MMLYRLGRAFSVLRGGAAFLRAPPLSPRPAAAAPQPPPAAPVGARLTTLLSAARSVADLRGLALQHDASLESSQHAVICVMAARLGGGDAVALLGVHAARWLASGGGGGGGAQDSLHRARQVANILHAAAKLLQHRAGVALVAALAADAGSRAAHLTAQGAATALWALERLRTADGGALAAVVGAAAREAPRFAPADAVMALAAAARLLSGGARGAPASAAPALRSAFPPLLAAAAREAPRFDTKQAASCLWAAARAEQDPWRGADGGASALVPLFAAAARCAGDFSPSEAANCLWAAARLRWEDGAHVGALARAAVREAHWCNARDAATCLWAAAALNLRDRDTVTALLAAALRHVEALDATGAVRALWGAVELRAGAPAELEPLVRAARRHLDTAALAGGERALLHASLGKLRSGKYS
jgi:hypothetical protein